MVLRYKKNKIDLLGIESLWDHCSQQSNLYYWEKVQLGGTSNYKDILGRISVTTTIEGVTARILYDSVQTR